MAAIRVGMVGGGFMGRAYSLALSAVYGLAWPAAPEIRRVRLAEVSHRLGERAARAWGWDEVSDDWRAITRADDVDLVLVLTPNDSHAEISIDALAHGKHVLCENPLSNTLEGARAMYRAAARSGRVHQVGFVYRKWPAVAFARQVIDAGGIGEIVHYRGHFFHDWALDPDMPIGWRLSRALAGGGSGVDLGSHAIDLARCLAGEIEGVCAASRTHFTRRPRAGRPGETAPVDVDEVTDLLVEFESGATGTLQTSWLAGGHKMDIGFAVHGTRGSIEFTSEEPTEVRLYKTSDPASESGFRAIPVGPAHPGAELFWPVPGMALGFGDGFIIAVRDLLRAVAEGRPAAPDFLDGLRANEVIAAAQASVATRTWQPVERLEVRGELELG
ncbi:MAG TPA: Gfo/Idh/MocA family oxidoreductase [Geminicoccaceae bacterium]|nr:Gfo/Idh/MocA family oxidoreductase [Geminicoccaceae bacterium]